MDYKKQCRAITELIMDYGQTSGEHHKAWVIDQILRLVAMQDYEKIVSAYCKDGEYEWDEGVAP